MSFPWFFLIIMFALGFMASGMYTDGDRYIALNKKTQMRRASFGSSLTEDAQIPLWNFSN